MSARARMTQRVTIQRATSVTDDFNQPGVQTWSDLATVACWSWTTTEAELVGGGRTAVATQLWAIVPRGTAVTEQDRLRDVVDRRATVIHAGVLNIEAVINRRDHLQLALRAVA